MPSGLEQELDAGVAWLEGKTGRRFGATGSRLLLSVRSGAAISMPGMMDTILNLGMDDEAEAALAQQSGLPAFARDTHRRFLELYSNIVLKTPIGEDGAGADPASLREQIRMAGHELPATPRAQLSSAVAAVFTSWNSRRARRYREHHHIPHDLGTAVTVQAMVFGNLDENSGTGVIFSRNPLSGERTPYGEYLQRAQGEDVVSGRFTPQSLDSLRTGAAAVHSELLAATALLEREHGDIQDIEFTVQEGRLYLLQSRTAKRAPNAAVRAAVEMVAEGMIDVDTALGRVTAEQVRSMLFPRLCAGADHAATVLARGEGACPGVASGVFVDESDEAERRAAKGESVILMRKTTSPDDIHGMIAAKAIVTELGGSTSHAAVVSRALGRPCVVGVGGESAVRPGLVGTVDGGGGVVYAGALAVETPDEEHDPHLRKMIEWAQQRCPVAVLRPRDAGELSECVDLDAELASVESATLASSLKGKKAARGAILATPDAARQAAACGVKTIVTEPVLPALLAILSGAA
jgi:pyruvate,orthophosphate dikinase